MMTRIVGTCAGVAVALTGCRGSDRSGSRAWDEPLPSLTIELPPQREMTTVGATVEAVPAPEIQFPALLQADPNHVSPVLAPVTGIVIRIADERHARRRDTLAIIGQGSEQAGRMVPVRGVKDGQWRPRLQPRQLVWQGDTLGVIEEHGFWLAIGAISDIDARFVHAGDPAMVLLNGETDAKHRGRPGRVEWARRAGPSAFSVDVAVEVRGREEEFARGGFATVVVIPSGPGDSLAAVPASAVVQLPLGPAVFVPAGTGRYDVRWVATGPSLHGKVLIREGVKAGTTVVAHGLAALAAAARDSLGRRTGKPSQSG